MKTILKISKGAAARPSVLEALQEAGIGVVEVEDWAEASDALQNCGAALVFCDGQPREGVEADDLRRVIGSLGSGAKTAGLPTDVARSISHELRTPLSAMAGWLHLMESGKLDAEGMKRAITRLRGNIEDQVRTIDRFLGTNTTRS